MEKRFYLSFNGGINVDTLDSFETPEAALASVSQVTPATVVVEKTEEGFVPVLQEKSEAFAAYMVEYMQAEKLYAEAAAAKAKADEISKRLKNLEATVIEEFNASETKRRFSQTGHVVEIKTSTQFPSTNKAVKEEISANKKLKGYWDPVVKKDVKINTTKIKNELPEVYDKYAVTTVSLKIEKVEG